jgi:hypothetical protein
MPDEIVALGKQPVRSFTSTAGADDCRFGPIEASGWDDLQQGSAHAGALLLAQHGSRHLAERSRTRPVQTQPSSPACETPVLRRQDLYAKAGG